MKRERQVFQTREIAHKWAHQTQAEARNPQGNLYFRGATLYSYRDTYPIAKIFKKKAAVLVLHVENTYSATTSGHCHLAKYAASHLPSMVVPDVEPDNRYSYAPDQHAQNIRFLTEKAASLLAKAQRALSTNAVHRHCRYAQATLQNARDYSVFFSIQRKVPAFPATLWDAAAARARRIENPDPASADKRERARAQRKAVCEAKQEYEAEMVRSQRAARAEADFYLSMAKRSDWRLHDAFDLSCDGRFLSVLLRVNGDEIETSEGARIPIAHAARIWKAVEAVRASGVPYKHNGHSIHAGDYRIDRIDADGTLRAGCHVIPHSELRAMARQLRLGAA